MKKQLPNCVFFRTILCFILSILTMHVVHAQTTVTYTNASPGTGTWTCPYGVTSVTIETWGAGGGGGAGKNGPGGGGGGGAYNTATVAVSYLHAPYVYIIGSGGTGSSSVSAGATGGAGTASSFDGGTTANGGSGGGSTSGGLGTAGAGGAGGTHPGGAGAAGISSGSGTSGGGGGSAGSTGAGGAGGNPTAGLAGTGAAGSTGAAGGAGQTTNNPGGTPAIDLGGGGGGGRNSSNQVKNGGDGANGQVKITYTISCLAPLAQPTSLIFTPTSTTIPGSFTASATADGYIVIRTATSTAPTNPTNGSTYTVGAGLGGYIESVGASISFTSSGLTAGTQYWYWVFAMNSGCVGGTKYNTTSPLTLSSCTLATAPTNQPTALVLTPGTNSIGGSFTAASPAASNYLVVRTATATAPSSPVNGTVYTVGASALGGIIESVSSATTFTSTGLADNTHYWYWVYAYNSTPCGTTVYKTATPLSGNAFTCTPPTAQATSLVLTAGVSNISGSFTAATPAVTGYVVIRTTTSTAPTNPVNGTTYTAGSSALGGFIESAGAAITFNSTSLSASTQYWYWVFAYNTTTCGTMYLTASPLTATTTTLVCGVPVNTATITTTGTATYQWSALTWSLGHLPGPCENAQIILNDAGTANSSITVNLDVDTTVYSFKMSNISPGPYVHVFSTTGNVNLKVLNDFTVDAPSGNKYNRSAFANTKSTTIFGNLYLGRATGTAAEGMGAIGSTGNTAGQLYTLYGDMYFYPRGYTTDEHAVFIFDKAGTQHIYNYTLPTDTIEPVLFEDLRIGNVNATTLIMGGTVYDGYMENQGRAGLTIGANSTLDLPANYSLNVLNTGVITPNTFKMLAGARLRLGGDQSITMGVPGSNFPNTFSAYTWDAASTVEYYGSNAITQTIYNGGPYKNLEMVNGSGTGRAQKITTGPVNVATSINIKTGADCTLGSTVSSVGPFNVLTNGGLYCGTNIVSGAGAFTLQTGGYLGMGHVQGISSGTAFTGNVQVTGGRSFSTGGNYIYNGSAAQITGNGLPATCNDLTIDNPTTVTIAADLNVTGVNNLKQGTYDIGTTHETVKGTGTLTSVTGKMKANVGILEMNGSSGTAQALDGSWFVNKNISTLINSNTTGITLAATANDTLLVSSALLYGTGTTNSAVTTNNNLTLLSRDTATARFGEIVTGSGNTITGNVNVERYIGSTRKWRLLGWNTTSTQTARQSWMENNATANGNLTSGYGTIVTDEKSTWAVNNFDSRSVSGPSVKYYNPATNDYTGIPNTTAYQMNSNSAYYNFVRGDRSCTPANSLVSATVLRSTGTLKTGDQTFTITAGKFGAVGNPYASPIDIRKIDTLNLTGTFYVWDPNLGGIFGLGAYQTIYASGTNYKVLPGGGSYGALNSFADTIESGQAFFVKARASAGTITFHENAKTLGARVMARDPNAGVPAVYSLLSLANLGSNTLVDGAMAAFDPAYNNAVDYDDALKMVNTSENVSYKRDGQLLAIERRQNPVHDDTLFINVTGYRVHQYQWDITLDQMDAPDRTAFLIDNYLGTSTPLNLTGTNAVMYMVENIPGSYAADRFMIVFKQPAVLPVRFTSISAIRNTDKTVTVKWNTENEINMQDYKVQHSNDGVSFTDIGTQLPSTTSGGAASYSYIDTHATAGVNYYRIKGNSLNGQVQYTAIVKVGPLGSSDPKLSVYPNPVTDGNVNLRFENEPKGNYSVSISNKLGQILHTEDVESTTGNFVRMISLGAKIAKGSYQVTVKAESGTMTTIPFIVE